MTLPSSNQQPPITNDMTDPSNTTKTTSTTEHYARQSNTTSRRTTRATRSKDSHRCITIRGCGPASGRPGTALVDLLRVVDLCKIVNRWSPC